MKTLTAIAGFLLVSTPSVRAADAVSAMNSWVGGRLASNEGSSLAYVFLLLGGLLASLLPCVYPLYPITASIVKGRGGHSSARWLHPVSYYFGLAAMYALLGFAAGLSGGAFNTLMRLPLVNIALSFLFLVLALATAGFLTLHVFAGAQTGDKAPGVAGTFVMGAGAGLVSSSCVGPFVVSILIGIAGSAVPGHAVTSALSAGVKMLAFGLGVGIPFLLVGLMGARLPRSGTWMKHVQWLLGVLILYFSYTYLEKGLSILGFQNGLIQAVFISAIVLLYCSYRLQPSSVDEFARMPRALHFLVALLAALTLARGIISASAPTAVPTASQGQTSGPVTEQKGNLTWFLKREDATAEAQRRGRPVFIDFFGSWCANCKEFEKRTHSNQKLNDALSKVVLLKIEDTDPAFAEWQKDARFPELKVGLPFFVITDAKGNLLFKTSDYTQTDEMLLFLQE